MKLQKDAEGRPVPRIPRYSIGTWGPWLLVAFILLAASWVTSNNWRKPVQFVGEREDALHPLLPVLAKTSESGIHAAPPQQVVAGKLGASLPPLFYYPRIYIYDLPEEFMPCQNESWYFSNYGAEKRIPDALRSTSYVTHDPAAADFFYVPAQFYCTNDWEGHRVAAKKVLDHIRSNYTFWNASRGVDHIFTFTHDHGFCGLATADGVPEELSSSIILSHWGLQYPEVPCSLDDRIYSGGCPVRTHEALHGNALPCFVPGKDIVVASTAMDGLLMVPKDSEEAMQQEGTASAPEAEEGQGENAGRRHRRLQNAAASAGGTASISTDLFEGINGAAIGGSSKTLREFASKMTSALRGGGSSPAASGGGGGEESAPAPAVFDEFGGFDMLASSPAYKQLPAPWHAPSSRVEAALQTASPEETPSWVTVGKQQLVFFAGDIRSEDITYSHGVRQSLVAMFNNTPGFRIVDSSKSPLTFTEVLIGMSESVFCVAATGAGWGVRFKLAAMLRCIPVIIADGVEFEYEEILPYHDFSIRIPQHAMYRLPVLLNSLVENEPGLVRRMQRRLDCAWTFFSWRTDWGQAREALLCSLRRRLPGGETIRPVLDYGKCRLLCGNIYRVDGSTG